ncbi:UDP-forming cellulose synthase catalytic subunit [Aurantimonas aggregata]|uniref:Cellulose synthase catalytic subunit [UDP-forming] n=1 Tax=Aurantimonas aggregata TaxID=2047720 RepID=A0A6L9MGI7_9HYPH|nr:UDP-forming cellulose synthase catalytic subunit [Aurantimonas aggregata]NDV86732.1 UDP-forming cellulose synthase catalytic subunit [Aurantimonas aggregata]
MLKILFAIAWLLAAALALLVITLPISLQAQLVAVALVLGVMMLLKVLKLGGTWRLIALALGTTIVLRYVYWRTTSTLPPVNQLENFIPGFLLYLAEMYSVFMLALSLFVVAAPLPPRSGRDTPHSDRLPSVDVFVPSYNEDYTLLANTLAAALKMNYPSDRMKVWLLDDGATSQKRSAEHAGTAQAAEKRHVILKQLCLDLGATYLTRERNEHAKAGNLNNGMLHSDAELIAVFDADHAPARDFLLQTVSYFEQDPRLFLVQTPHFFINPDPVERNLSTFEKMPSENEMFYGIIQRGLDKWNAAFFCGSAAVLRREALDEAGGFSGVSITEDCETALDLHSRGWNSLYVDIPLIAGLQPATFASFIQQRSRWAQGMMQIMLFRFPLFKRGLSFPQRLCYMSSTLFWLFPFPRTMFLVAPLFYLFFGLEIFNASGGEFLAYTSTYIIVNLMMQNYLYGSFRWPWISELYEYVQTVHLLPAVVSVLINPRRPTFNVTAKDESILTSRLSEISLPFFVIFFVLLLGVAATVWRVINEPAQADLTLVVGGWNVLNLLIAGCALGVVSERGARSSSRRIGVARRCELLVGDQAFPATINDVSVGGARVQVFGDSPLQTFKNGPATLRFQPHSSEETATLSLQIRNCQKESDGASIGCSYIVHAATDHFLIADLIFANSEQWRSFQLSRRRNPGLIRGTGWFIGLCFYQTSRGLSYLARRAMGPKKSASPAQKRAVTQ